MKNNTKKYRFGTYIDGEGWIYSLHPFVKFSLSIVLAILAGISKSWLALLPTLFILFLILSTSGLGLFNVVKSIKPFRIFLIFTFVFQLFFTTAGKFATPNIDSANLALFFTARLAIMICFSSLFTFITKPLDIVRIFHIFFLPLKLIKISPTEVALSMLVALRFIPLLFTEAEKIVDSQKIKGVLPEKSDTFKKRITVIKGAAALIIPLFVRSFHYASQIAITMRYRKIDGDFVRLSPLARTDIYALSILILSFTIIVAVGRYFA